jgi:hypothetical protein
VAIVTAKKQETRAKAALPWCAFEFDEGNCSGDDAKTIVDQLLKLQKRYPKVAAGLKLLQVLRHYGSTAWSEGRGRAFWEIKIGESRTREQSLRDTVVHEFGHCCEYWGRTVDAAKVEAFMVKWNPGIVGDQEKRDDAEERWADGLRDWYDGKRSEPYVKQQQALLKELAGK